MSPSCYVFTHEALQLKYGFHKKYFRKNESLTSWTLFPPFFSRSALISTDLEKKWGQKCSTGQFHLHRSNFLQNPYFSLGICKRLFFVTCKVAQGDPNKRIQNVTIAIFPTTPFRIRKANLCNVTTKVECVVCSKYRSVK